MKSNLKITLQIIFTSVLLGLIYNHLSPNGISLYRDDRKIVWASDSMMNNSKSVNETPNVLESSPAKEKTISEKSIEKVQDFKEPIAIKIDFAYKLFLEGKIFIDARPVDEFEESHIKGAINIPFYGSENYQSVLNKILKDEVVVTYCSGEDCELSILLGNELFEKGYKKVYVFFGGWNDWLKKGYPISKK